MEPIAQDLEPENDRRRRPRFRMRAPVTLFLADGGIQAYTRDLSNRGVYFYLSSTDSNLHDRVIEFQVELPPEVTLSTSCSIRCWGHLIRKEKASGGLTGVAAKILRYSIF